MSDKSNVLENISAVINQILQQNGAQAVTFNSEDALVGTLGLDSMDLAVLVVELEQRLGLDPFREGQGAVRTVGELADVYEKALSGSV